MPRTSRRSSTSGTDEPWTLLVGDDRLLARGLQAGWDGGISGVAGFCPELLVRLYQSVVAGRADETARLQALLDELIAQIAVFPTPWGIRDRPRRARHQHRTAAAAGHPTPAAAD